MCKVKCCRITAFIVLLMPILPILFFPFTGAFPANKDKSGGEIVLNGILFILWVCVALTTWGMFFSCIFFPIGMRLAYKKDEEINDSNKYNFFAAWKWYIIFFEVFMTMNIVITVVFWGVITQFKDVFGRSAGFLAYSSYIHSTPLIMFMFEYGLHSIPVIKRHIVIIFPIGVIYALINLTHTKISG